MPIHRHNGVRRLAPYLLAIGALSAGTPDATAQKLGRGTAAPEIDLPTLAGGRVKLSELRGKPVVVTFWGTWCPPCRNEFPELVALQKKYRESGLVVLAVNQRDQELSTKAVQDFAN
jgi:thiol-disulfide isomerase/thioredoxin